MVQDSWYEGLYKPDGHPIINYLDNYRERLLAWNKSEFGHVGRKIDSCKKDYKCLKHYLVRLQLILKLVKYVVH